MQTGIPTLFVEINDPNYIFVVGKYDENQNLKIIEKLLHLMKELKRTNLQILI